MTSSRSNQKLSSFMKVSIAILAVVTLASISLLFIGDFEGKFERVFSTLALFTVFVLLTAFDTRKEQKNEWYAPVALIANAYILGLLLIVIWVTPYDPFNLSFTILWKSVFVIVTTRLVTFGLELLLGMGLNKPDALGRWGQVTGVLGVITLIMFTAPLGIEAFNVTVPALYWKFSVATLILTALGLAITLLLNWYYRPVVDPHAERAYVTSFPAGTVLQPTVTQVSAEVPSVNVTPAVNTPEPPVATSSQLLPWPTFTDGSPYPQLPDGQPDFATAQQILTADQSTEKP